MGVKKNTGIQHFKMKHFFTLVHHLISWCTEACGWNNLKKLNELKNINFPFISMIHIKGMNKKITSSQISFLSQHIH